MRNAESGELRETSRVIIRLIPPVCAIVAAGIAVPAVASAHATTYTEARVQQCLLRRDVSAGKIPISPQVRHYLPAGAAGELVFLGDIAGARARVDDGTLYFFKSPALALAGLPKMVSKWVYGKGLPTYIKALTRFKPPPTKVAARSLFRVYGNVIGIWSYPRRWIRATDSALGPCFR